MKSKQNWDQQNSSSHIRIGCQYTKAMEEEEEDEEHIGGGWDVILKKNVRTEDGLSAGVVVGVSEDSLIIEDAPNREFVVPKEDVEGFDVSEIYVNLLKEELVSRHLREV